MSQSRKTAKIHYPQSPSSSQKKQTSAEPKDTTSAEPQQPQPTEPSQNQNLPNTPQSTPTPPPLSDSTPPPPQSNTTPESIDKKVENQDNQPPPSTSQPAEPPQTQPTPSTNQTSDPLTIESLKAEVKKYYELALRTQADFDNYRKRIAREREESTRYANAALLERLLPILDSFELGLQAARKAPEAEAIAKGFELVERQLQDFLRECGVEPIDATGKAFDPNLHEAVSQQHHDQIPPGHVIHQIRRGFKLHDRLLRPATVIVSCGKPLEGVSA